MAGQRAERGPGLPGALIENSPCRYGRKEKALYRLDLGAALHYAGKYAESERHFDKAEKRMEELYTKSLTQMLGTLVINDASMEYAGEPHERALLHIFRALNYVGLGNISEALVESRKVEVFLGELNRKAGDKSVYRDDAFARYLDSLLYEDMGNTDDARVSLEAAKKAYSWYEADYHTPTPRFSLEKNAPSAGELVFIHFNGMAPRKTSKVLSLTQEKAIGIALRAAAPDENGPFRKALSTLGIQTAGLEYSKDAQEPQDASQEDLGGLLEFLGQKASASPRAEERSAQPPADSQQIVISFPVYVAAPPAAAGSVVAVDGQDKGETVLMEDISAIAIKALEDRMNQVRVRAIARATIKYILAKAAADLAAKQCEKAPSMLIDMCKKTARKLAEAVVAGTETADTRSWGTLPAEIRMARVSLLPGLRQVEVRFMGASGEALGKRGFQDVRIEPGKRTYLQLLTAYLPSSAQAGLPAKPLDLLGKADKLTAAKRYAEAESELYRAALRLPENDPLQASIYLRLGESARLKGGCEKAVPLYVKSVQAADRLGMRRGPVVAGGYAGMGQCLLESKDPGRAKKAFGNSLEAGPDPRTEKLAREALSKFAEEDAEKLAQEAAEAAKRAAPPPPPPKPSQALTEAKNAYSAGDHQLAFKLLLPAARAGNPAAQALVGQMYSRGDGVGRDYRQAFVWLSTTAQKGLTMGQYSLGRLYEDGNGVGRDDSLAAFWFRKAAAQGHADAQFRLGRMCYYGQGVPQDMEEAKKLLKQAARQGHDEAAAILKARFEPADDLWKLPEPE